MEVAPSLAARLPVLIVVVAGAALGVASPALRRLLGPPERAAALHDLDAPVWRNAAAVLLLAALAAAALSYSHAGYNVDEYLASLNGAAIVDWYAALLWTREFEPFTTEPAYMNYYGGAFDAVAELVTRVSPLEHTETRHLVSAGVGVFALLGAYVLGCSVHSRAAGALSVLVLLLTPRFVGHFFNNPKDVPFAAFTVWALAGVCGGLGELPRLPLRRVLWIGAASGAAMGIRVGGVVTLGYFGMALLWWLGGEVLRARAGGARPGAGDVLALSGRALAVFAIAWASMLLAWPWALAAPIGNPAFALFYFQDIVDQLNLDFPVFFEGRYYPLSAVPRSYTWRFLWISLPEFALLAPLGLLPAAASLRRWRPGWPGVRGMQWVLVVASFAVPLSSTLSRGLIQYDGIRHFLFVLPPLALLLAVAGIELWRGAGPGWLKRGAAGAAAGLMALTAFDMLRLHPYQYAYFNRAVAGGLSAAARSFETDPLGLSYREGVRWVLANPPLERAPLTRITICPGFLPNLHQALASDPERAQRFQAVVNSDAPDVAVATEREGCHQRFRGRVLHTIERDGAPLLYVLRVGPGYYVELLTPVFAALLNADGRTLPSERVAALGIARRITRGFRQQSFERELAAGDAKPDFEALERAFEAPQRQAVLRFLEELARADGGVAEEEQRLLDELARRFGAGEASRAEAEGATSAAPR